MLKLKIMTVRCSSMAKPPKSFNEFYYRTMGVKEDLENLVNYVENNDEKLGKYEGEVFCPECNSAELYFVHKTSKVRAHLRRYPTSKHEDGCSYNYEYAPRKQAREIINSLTYNEIQDKLNSMINLLCKEPRKKKGSIDNGIDKTLKDNPMLISMPKENENIIRALRRKKLNSWVDEDDKNELFVFYGQVKLEVEENVSKKEGKEPYTYYRLKVYNQNKEGKLKFRTSIYRGKKKDDINIDDLYYIAIIGQIGDKAWKIDMVNTNAIKYCKCQESL